MARSPSRRIIAALEKAATILKNIGDEEDVADFLDDNDITDDEDVQSLRKSCHAIANLLRIKTTAVKNSAALDTSKVLDQYFVLRAGSSSVKLVAPIEEFHCNKYYNNKKVMGFLRRQGDLFPLMVAFPGWKACAEAHPRLLDSDIWSNKVLEFAENVGHHFKLDGWDIYHKMREGLFQASHVEPKLMLSFACYLQKKRLKEKLDLRKLHHLRRLTSRIEAEIIISEEPCASCKKFKEDIELVTGLKFTFKVCENLGMLKSYRDSHGRKKYPRFASDESEATDSTDIEDDYPLQARSPHIMVVVTSNLGSSTSNPKERRQKRKYEDSDDEEEYKEPRHRSDVQNKCANMPAPRTRGSTRTITGLISPGPSPSSRNVASKAENVATYGVRRYDGKREKWR
ncbi:hypothetical protein OIDMADRAFT_26867 [Oidiodendron maius Zn]|uniref:Single-strand DNA deaminase toxin A-like C-terminal domain-containing protein n=1 Tax=Oidiodendron maius (strain Zn) TaxID=913774 RepID=A0A0C3CZ12_OIDMZ|nr:hypothetical protein OIDMADRAFT_26867 [Oidiodendron maius Zn]